jgi:hypothetical protein
MFNKRGGEITGNAYRDAKRLIRTMCESINTSKEFLDYNLIRDKCIKSEDQPTSHRAQVVISVEKSERVTDIGLAVRGIWEAITRNKDPLLELDDTQKGKEDVINKLTQDDLIKWFEVLWDGQPKRQFCISSDINICKRGFLCTFSNLQQLIFQSGKIKRSKVALV